MNFNALNGNVLREGNVDNTQNIISFCTGYGGLELGIKRAGVDVRTIVNVEIEAFCCANMAAKIEEGRMDNAPIWTDLKTFPAREFRGKVHGLIGGYPCQPFSSAGKRQGEKDPRHLWPYILKHVRAIRPVWCFWENVAGHTTMGLWRVLSDLEEEGYRTTWNIFSAEEVGAPHQRKRVFILARLGNSNVRYEGSHGIERRVLPTQTEDRQASGLERASDTRQVGNSPSLRPHRGSENCEGEQSEVLGERLESDELGYTKHDGSSTTQDGRSTCEEQKEGRMQELERGCKQSQDELANPTSRQPRQSQARNGGQDTSGGSEEELGNTTKQRPQDCGEQREVGSESEATSGEGCESTSSIEHAMSAHHGRGTRWPARPGEEQYEWEEPRVVADSKSRRSRESGDKHQERERCESNRGSSEGCDTDTEIESKLGGESHAGQRHDRVDAIANRVDRLRLLGNGVCPQTAELAWKTLWKELNAT